MEKYHKQEVSPVEEENERDETFEADNPQIDSERTKGNYHMNSNGFGSYTEFINKRLKELGLKPRKDAVVMNSFVVGSDKAFFDGLSKIQRYNFFSDCTKFFEERYGEENIMSAVVHLDETTPHMHLNLIPITPDGRLCSKDLFDKPKLQQLQTDFYEDVGKKYGLKRGKEGSQAKHLSTAEYKAKKITEEAEEIRRENQVYADALEETKNGEIPKKRRKLQEQVVALMVENKSLTERLDRSMQDNKIIRKLYEDNVSGRITDKRFDYLSKSYEEEQNELNRKVQELKEILAVVDSDNEKLAKFIRIVKQYTEIEELTPDILHSFVDRICIGETEVYEGQKFQDVKIVYNLVGAIDLPQYAM